MRRWNQRHEDYDVEYYYKYKRGWDSGLGNLLATNCSYAKRNNLGVVVNLPFEVEATVSQLVKEIQGEFLAYCLGTKSDDGHVYTIEGLYIPSQEVGLDRVEVTETDLPEDKLIIGTVHSHWRFPAFISSVDSEFIGNNYDLSVVVGSNGQEWLAVARVKLPCGMLHLVEAEIKFDRPKIDLEKEIEKIKIQRTPYVDRDNPA